MTSTAQPTASPEPPIQIGPPARSLSADFLTGLAAENPVMVQMLGLCPAMAVSNSLANGLVMGIATTLVLVGSSLFISLASKYLASEVRLASYILIIATFVTVADLVLAAGLPEISKALGPFVPLIVVNCLILGRAEAFAGKVGPARAVADAAGMGAGFTATLSIISAVRELLGSGSLLGVDVLGPRFEPWVIMVMPPGGFLTLGILFLIVAWREERRAAGRKGAAS